MAYELKNNRFLCWDECLVETADNVTIKMQKPEKKNVAFTCDHHWEGNCCSYGSVFKVGDTYRFYYRGTNHVLNATGHAPSKPTTICVSESKDGKTFTKPSLKNYEFDNSLDNNIVYTIGKYLDNFSVCYDANPDCKKEERYKALAPYDNGNGIPTLGLFVSEDGYKFEFLHTLDLHGAFDSYNVLFWDEISKEYRIYYRGNHEGDHREHDTSAVVGDARTDVRDVRLATSKDLIKIDVKGILEYTKEDSDWLELYTNQVGRYYRANDMFIGLPGRYIDRKDDAHNLEDMPLAGRRALMTKIYGRGGTAMTDCAIMTSRDGFTFQRWGEAFIRPGIESRKNWWYGDCFSAFGIVETESDTEGAPNELSFYLAENYRVKAVEFRRYTIRMDGFFSWNAPHAGGSVLTKPLTFTGEEMEVNFSTSAFGGLTVTICDEAGNPIEGYTSKTLFGDAIDRKMKFDKSLKDLNGKPVRLKFTMKDCDLYSFKFNQ